MPAHNALIPIEKAPVEEGVNAIRLADLMRCSQLQARALLPQRFAEQYQCLPVSVHDRGEQRLLNVLLSRELSESERRELQFISESAIVASVIDAAALPQAIALLYAEDLLVARAREGSNTTAGVCQGMLLEAVRRRCSDLHLEYDQRDARIRFRIRGTLAELGSYRLGREEAQQLVRHIKALARLDTAAPMLPQEGAYEWRDNGLLLRIRVSSIPTVGGEKLVLRLLHNGCLEEIASQGFETQLNSLGLFPEQRAVLGRFLRAERGALLISGPTGSGKSTLLYVLLRQLAQPSANVISLEDPVEAEIPNACQIDLSRLSIGFEEALQRIQRQDPDVLLIGEIRNRESASTALQAAIAGSKVLGSIHAGSCFEVLARLMEFGISEALLSLSLHTLSAQRLIPRNCPYCSYQEREPSATRAYLQIADTVSLQASAGCDRCVESGRIAVFEFLEISHHIRRLLQNHGSHQRGEALREVAQQAFSEGFRSYGFYVRELLLRGTISADAAAACLGI